MVKDKKNWQDALRGLGAKESPATPSPTGVTVGESPEQQYAEPAGLPAGIPPWETKASPDPATHRVEALRWSVAGIELLGEDNLVRELTIAHREGTGRARDTFDRKVETAIGRLPRSRAEEMRAALPPLGGRKGVPTFQRESGEVLDSIVSGAVAKWVAAERSEATQAESLALPTIGEGEDLEAALTRLQTWEGQQPDALLKRLGWTAYNAVATERTRREEARKAAEAKKLADAITAFNAGGSFEELAAVLGSEYTAKGAVAGTPRAWEMYRVGKSDYPTVPPPADWLAGQTDIAWLVEQAKPAWRGGQFRPLFHQQLLAVLPGKPSANRGVVVVNTTSGGGLRMWMAVTTTTIYNGAGFGDEAPVQNTNGYATEPHPEGWVQLPRPGESNPQAVYLPPAKFTAYEAVHAHRGRGVDIRSWMQFYRRHPEKGFGRFRIGVVAGAAHRDFKTVSVDDRAAKYLDALAAYPAGYEVPSEAYRVPLRLVKKHDQGGHLVWDEGATKPGVSYVAAASWVQMSRRSSGGFISGSGGNAASWSCSTSTAKHTESAVFAIIREGERLDLDSGAAIVCRDGKAEKVAGGALRPGNVPTE